MSQATGSRRLLFFDILRIFFVVAIVYVHHQFSFLSWFNNLFYADGYLPFNLYPVGLQGWAVYGLIFISGAVLEYNYKQIEGYLAYSKFMVKRFIRIYPAFWLSLLFGLILNIMLTLSTAAEIIKNNFFSLLFEYTGFFVILGQGPGFINTMGWFIAAIISLYLIFPWLSGIVKKYQLPAILAFMIISFGSRSLFFTYDPILPNLLWRWFPLCNLFEFCLGIYIVQMSFYPKNVNDYPIIHEIAELSFYVFLFHVVINYAFIHVFTAPVGYGPVFTGYLDLQFSHYPLLKDILPYITIEGTILIVSIIAMKTDRKIQQWIRQNKRMKDFLISK